jgi:hypothetical protein
MGLYTAYLADFVMDFQRYIEQKQSVKLYYNLMIHMIEQSEVADCRDADDRLLAVCDASL